MNWPRCRKLDADGCRCMRKEHKDGPHDFSYTVWPGETSVSLRGERFAVDGRTTEERWGP
jgi:hypothetical protein